jgi:hypothetical protein
LKDWDVTLAQSHHGASQEESAFGMDEVKAHVAIVRCVVDVFVCREKQLEILQGCQH